MSVLCSERLAVGAVVLFALGCGSGAPFDYVQVSGTVRYQDESPLPTAVRVAFVSQAQPVEQKYHPRPAYTFTDENGQFDSVTSQRPGDGVVPGRHKVLLFVETDHPERIIPAEYSREQSTPLEVDTADAPFELRIRKP